MCEPADDVCELQNGCRFTLLNIKHQILKFLRVSLTICQLQPGGAKPEVVRSQGHYGESVAAKKGNYAIGYS